MEYRCLFQFRQSTVMLSPICSPMFFMPVRRFTSIQIINNGIERKESDSKNSSGLSLAINQRTLCEGYCLFELLEIVKILSKVCIQFTFYTFRKISQTGIEDVHETRQRYQGSHIRCTCTLPPLKGNTSTM